MNIETIHIGHTIIQRWEEGLAKHFSYLNWKGELIVHHGDQWWDLFDILKTGNLVIRQEHMSSCSRFQQMKIITFKASTDGKRLSLYGPAWSDLIKAIKETPSVQLKLDFQNDLETINEVQIIGGE